MRVHTLERSPRAEVPVERVPHEHFFEPAGGGATVVRSRVPSDV